jgi:hypothetical protein
MRPMRHLIFVLGAIAALCAGSIAQDSPSLGDLARQQRQQKGQSKSGKSPDGKAPKVITNEEIPEHSAEMPAAAVAGEKSEIPQTSPGESKAAAAHWTSQISAQKSQIASLQRQMEQMKESIRFAPANCVGRCVEWNERQRQKQEQVERMQAQLDEQKGHLQEMQESARKQGYGSSVYDP